MNCTHLTRPSLLKICAAVTLALGSLSAVAAVGIAAQPQSVQFTPDTDHLIVKYKEATPASAKRAAKAAVITAERKAIVDRAGQQFGMKLSTLRTISSGAHVFKLDKRMMLKDVQALAAELMARDPSVEYAEPDTIMTALMTPTDPSYSQQWDYYEATGGLNLPTAWDSSTGTGVTVAVIDTGYRPHADLSGAFLPGYDFISDLAVANDGNGRDSDASDPGDWITANECYAGSPASNSSWHGTHVAGTIAGRTNNGLGVAGVAFNAKIVPARVLGKCGGYASDIADAITWASGGTVSGVPANANPARVINMSLGGSGACDTTTQNAINGARSRGTVVVVAAGNSNTNVSTSNPANCSGVIAVAATNRAGSRASYSNYGTLIDVSAPGGDSGTGGGILSTLNAGTTTPGADSYASYMGTSMATPHVVGVVALMLSKNPSLTPDQVESTLKSTARPLPGTCTGGCGAGIVDAAAAVAAAAGGGGGGTSINETESNNTIATANSVTTTGTTVNGNIGSTTDADYFVVQLPAGKTLSATLTPPATADYDVYIYDSAGAELAFSENGTGLVDTATYTNTGGSTVARYVAVKYWSGGTGATNGKYTLKLTW